LRKQAVSVKWPCNFEQETTEPIRKIHEFSLILQMERDPFGDRIAKNGISMSRFYNGAGPTNKKSPFPEIWETGCFSKNIDARL
jgi:hypothetical protein